MNPNLPEKQWVVSVGVSKTSYAEVVELCRLWADRRRRGVAEAGRYICPEAVHGIILARDDASFARVLQNAAILTPDGMPLVWALRSFGNPQQQRVYGPTLMLEICRSAALHGHRIFLFGGRPETLPVLESRLTESFPALQIVGRCAPPFRPLTTAEDQSICQSIESSGADIVFVGIGTPKQQMWMARQAPLLPGITLLGVGAAFDFHAGATAQAPAWMQRFGFEWLFRLFTEPKRLWRRYLLSAPRFLPLWLGQHLKLIRESRP